MGYDGMHAVLRRPADGKSLAMERLNRLLRERALAPNDRAKAVQNLPFFQLQSSCVPRRQLTNGTGIMSTAMHAKRAFPQRYPSMSNIGGEHGEDEAHYVAQQTLPYICLTGIRPVAEILLSR